MKDEEKYTNIVLGLHGSKFTNCKHLMRSMKKINEWMNEWEQNDAKNDGQSCLYVQKEVSF